MVIHPDKSFCILLLLVFFSGMGLEILKILQKKTSESIIPIYKHQMEQLIWPSRSRIFFIEKNSSKNDTKLKTKEKNTRFSDIPIHFNIVIQYEPFLSRHPHPIYPKSPTWISWDGSASLIHLWNHSAPQTLHPKDWSGDGRKIPRNFCSPKKRSSKELGSILKSPPTDCWDWCKCSQDRTISCNAHLCTCHFLRVCFTNKRSVLGWLSRHDLKKPSRI